VERDIYIYIARDERWVHGGDSEAAGAGVFDHTEPDERLRAADVSQSLIKIIRLKLAEVTDQANSS
jgi:hypothetical protein